MKLGYLFLFAILSLNISSLIAESLDVGAGGLVGNVTLPSDIESLFNQTATATESNPLLAPLRGLGLFLKLFRSVIWGFPDLLTDLGAPGIIVTAVNVLWLAYWILFLLQLLTGREIE